MRIIGGRCRGRVVRFPPVAGLRPTPDRVRETLFNWLGQAPGRTNDARTLRGLGGALARGAVAWRGARRRRRSRPEGGRRDRRARRGSSALDGLDARRADARAFLEQDAGRYDVVFLDPPFADDPWAWLLPLAAARLAPDGAIYAEAGHALGAPPGLQVTRSARAGQVYYHLLRPDPGAP